MMLHNKYQGCRPCGFRQEDFSGFPLYKPTYVKHVTPGWGHFWLQGHNLNKLGRGPLGDATYQIPWLEGLWFQTRRFFSCFPNISQCKICDPRGGAIFCPRGIVKTSLVKVH